MARVLAEEGHEVTALASSGEYAGAVAQALDYRTADSARRVVTQPTDTGRREMESGQETGGRRRHGALQVETVRVPKWMPRALAWVWFTWQARQRIPRMDWDVCVLMTDPPLLPLLAARAKAAEGLRDDRTTGPRDVTRRVAVWLMDLYPEALAASGRIGKGNPIYRWYFEKRQRALSACDLLICLGQTQKELLDAGRTRHTANSLRPTRIAVVPPWDDRGNITLATGESLKNLALYAGNLGEAHCFEEVLAAAPYLPGDWTIRFAARGAKLGALKEKASELKRPRDEDTKRQGTGDGRQGAAVEVTGYATEQETPGLLASARVHLITMSPEWEGVVVPSKLYGCIRTGRPVLFIGPENADTAREIRAHDRGMVLPPGASGEKVAAVILELAARPTRATESLNGAAKVAELIQNLATADRREPEMAPRQSA